MHNTDVGWGSASTAAITDSESLDRSNGCIRPSIDAHEGMRYYWLIVD